MDILIVKLGALGDVINTLPLAAALKRRLNARITWLVEPLSRPLLEKHPCVDRVIVFDKKRWLGRYPDVRRRLKEARFDAVLDLQRLWKSGLLALTAATDRRIGFDRNRCKEMTWLLPFERITPADPGRHMLCQYMEFADHLGAKVDDITWQIPIPEVLPEGLPKHFSVLNIGATKPANRWTVRGFAGLSDALYDRYGLRSVITGGAEDADMAGAIAEAAKSEPVILAGKTGIEELIAVLDRAGFVVSCDTGPMHLAVALGKPVVALFGPSNPRRTGPFYGEVIQKHLPCVPCNKRHCRNPLCMQEITVADVMQRIERILIKGNAWSAGFPNRCIEE
ncbi:MAG: glycosyltransferase family 9 protein [Desulfobacteraceae bacterium]|nr:glycosyltransferase family 9 protein [Desulfobacteraceae bacterium]MCF8094812.1 glycosyltransferase family 9 protein [Desulfobacteraceae bacterium]